VPEGPLQLGRSWTRWSAGPWSVPSKWQTTRITCVREGMPDADPAHLNRARASAMRQIPRWRIFAGIWCFYLIGPFQKAVDGRSTEVATVGVLCLLGFLICYLGLLPMVALDTRHWPRHVLLGSMLVAVVVFGVVVHSNSTLNFSSFFAVALVMLLDRRHAAIGIPLLALAVGTVPWLLGDGTHFTFALIDLAVGAAVFAMRARGEADFRLGLANEEIGHLAAEQERLRISRDLHDLLGHALTTITVKAELASRLVERDPQRAAQEMAEVAELTRQGLADVRAAVAGYREVSLATELATAREVLQAAGIEAELPPATETVPGEFRELFGWVVREGVTNAVRHSGARHVRVVVGPREIQIVDDGAGIESASGLPGSGLLGLTERVAALGGRVESGPDGVRGFRLRVEMPA
jgi:two-component system sensor histidine kinase DesK